MQLLLILTQLTFTLIKYLFIVNKKIMKKIIVMTFLAFCFMHTNAQLKLMLIKRDSPKQQPISNVINSPVMATPLAALITTYSKKNGNTTLTLYKATPDKTTKQAVNKVMSSSDEIAEGKMICRTETRRYTAETMNQDILNPQAISNLRLGGVYSLEKMQAGNYATVNTNRLPTNIYLSNASQNAITVANPDELSLQQALDKVKYIPYPVTPSGVGAFLTTTQVTSAECLNVAANLSYSGFGFNASAEFKYNKDEKKNKFLLSYVNPTYSAFATPAQQGMFFGDPTLNTDNSYVYINQITYGVKLMVYFEENVSSEEINGKLEASGWGFKGGFESEVKNRMQNTNFKIYLYGSNEPLFVVVNGYDEMIRKVNQLLKDISIKNQTYPLQMGQPISYQLRFLDGDIAITNCRVEDMPQQICGPNPNMPLDLTVNLESYVHGGYGVDGNLQASLVLNGNEYWSGVIYGVPSQARIGSRDSRAVGPVAQLLIPNVSKEARDNGFLRISGIWNSNGDYFMNGINMVTTKSKFEPNKFNVFWRDIPLKDIIATAPGSPFTTTLEFRETKHSTATSFIPTISAKFVY